MAKDKKMVDAITSMDEDFAKWYMHVKEIPKRPPSSV